MRCEQTMPDCNNIREICLGFMVQIAAMRREAKHKEMSDMSICPMHVMQSLIKTMMMTPFNLFSTFGSFLTSFSQNHRLTE